MQYLLSRAFIDHFLPNTKLVGRKADNFRDSDFKHFPFKGLFFIKNIMYSQWNNMYIISFGSVFFYFMLQMARNARRLKFVWCIYQIKGNLQQIQFQHPIELFSSNFSDLAFKSFQCTSPSFRRQLLTPNRLQGWFSYCS